MSKMNDRILEIRKKHLEQGYDSLTEYEKILNILSYSEISKKTEISADKIMEVYGSLNSAINSDPLFLMKECGISQNTALFLKLIAALKISVEYDIVSKVKLDSVENAKKFFSTYLSGKKTEVVAAVVVDENFTIINKSVLAYGGFSEVHVPTRLVVEFALKNDAKYLFLSHCHPKGEASPSDSDIVTTKKIKEVCENLGLYLIDHIIVGSDDACSMCEINKEMFSDLPDYKVK